MCVRAHLVDQGADHHGEGVLFGHQVVGDRGDRVDLHRQLLYGHLILHLVWQRGQSLLPVPRREHLGTQTRAVTHQSVTHQSVTSQSVSHQAVTHQSVTHQSVTHQSVTHQSVTHQSVTHQEVTHQAFSLHHVVSREEFHHREVEILLRGAFLRHV